jgi:hypothetical protein
MGASNAPLHFEVSGSLTYLQPGSDNLEYATLVSPPPSRRPTGSIIRVNWAHLRSSDYASVSATPTQMVGPSYEIGPESAVFKNAQGALRT